MSKIDKRNNMTKPQTDANDCILRGTAYQDQFRFFAVNSTKTAQRARDLHDLSPLVTILMGRLISATAMLSAELKNKGTNVCLKLDCSGEVEGALVICEQDGALRGYARQPKLWFDEPSENFEIGKHTGKGTLTIIKELGMKKTFTGICELVSGEIGEDLANYYHKSEQVPTAVNLGVLIDSNAKVRASGGFIIQEMPFADPAASQSIIDNLNNTPNVSDLMDMGYCIEDILRTFVFKDIDFTVHLNQTLEYRCNCSREKFERALILLGKDELNEMLDGISPVCSYCGKEYHFDTEAIQGLISSIVYT